MRALRNGNRAMKVGSKGATTDCPDCCGTGDTFLLACPCLPDPLGDDCAYTEAPCAYIPGGAALDDQPTKPVIERLAEFYGVFGSDHPFIVNVDGHCYRIGFPGLYFAASVSPKARAATMERYGADGAIGDVDTRLTVLGASGDVLKRAGDCTSDSGCNPWTAGKPLIEALPCEGTPGFRLFLCAARPGVYRFGGYCWCVPADGQRYTEDEANDLPGTIQIIRPGDANPPYPSRIMIRQNAGGGGVIMIPASTCCYCDTDACASGSGWERVTANLWSLIDHCCGSYDGMGYDVNLGFSHTRTGSNDGVSYSINTSFTILSVVPQPFGGPGGVTSGSIVTIQRRARTTSGGVLVSDDITTFTLTLNPQCCLMTSTGDRVFPWSGLFAPRPDGIYADRVSAVPGREDYRDDLQEFVHAWASSVWGTNMPLPFFGDPANWSGTGLDLVTGCETGVFQINGSQITNPGANQIVDTVNLSLIVSAIWPHDGPCAESGCSGTRETLGGMLP